MRYPLEPHQRLALLEAWGERCAWCGRPLRYDELCVDHLLPQKLHDATEEMRQEIFEQFLPDALLPSVPPVSFDLHGLVNLVPSCSRDNRKKSDDLARIAAYLLNDSLQKLERIEERATKFQDDSEVQRALAILEASNQAAKGDAVARLVGSGIDTDIIRRLVRLNVAYGVVEYSAFHGGTATRRLWLVVPPGEQPLAVVLESPDDSGTSTQNAAETIAETLHQQYPGFLTVLHYDKEANEPWGNFWKPVYVGADGRGVFEGTPDSVREGMMRSLVAAGLISDNETRSRW